ncbi:MAG: serine/threonine protein kinase [Planctomycetes bacterium]|nr:serine/threonine protein kinase [Planctomycetota bacterium]
MHDATVLSRWTETEGMELVTELRQLWLRGQRPSVDAFLERHSPLPAEQVVALLTVDQLLRWQSGERIPVEEYLERHPDLHRDPEHLTDLVYGEFLLREECGERVDVEEYARRFPECAAMLQVQVELYRALQATPTTTVPPDLSKPTTSPNPRRSAQPPVQLALARSAGPLQLDCEIRTLLRARLMVIYLICIAGHVTLLGGKLIAPDSGLYFAWVEIAMVLGLTSHVIILWRGHDLSLRRLRRLELTGFGIVTACFGWFIFDVFSRGLLGRYAVLGAEGMSVLADHISGPWFALLIMYGVFVPNTWRRCAALVGTMAAAPLAVSAVMASLDGMLEVNQRLAFLFQMTWLMGFAAAIAIYGSHKINVLRQQAFETRQLGQYQVKKRLGAGGMGEVYLAEHVRLGRACALKLIRPDKAGEPRELRRFEREVRATAALSHPNVVQVFDYGHAADGTFYYAMEYLPGRNLEELVKQDGPLSPARALPLLRQVCAALREAHGVGLIHRDIKPSNIIVGDNGVAKLLDFGLVRHLEPRQDETRLTLDGDIAGTPAFMSPEQASGKRHLDARSDIYSVGALAYFLLAGQAPFAARSAVQVLAAHLYEEPAPLSEHCAAVPPGLEEIILRCLAKNPADRFADVASLLAALEETNDR